MKNTVSPVKELREKIGVSQRELADALGVHHALIANLELSMIDVVEDDEETQSKVNVVFDRLSEHTGIPKNQLFEQQALSTKNQKVSIKERAVEQLTMFVDKMIGKNQISNEAEYDSFIAEIEKACSSDDYGQLLFYSDPEGSSSCPTVGKSPISVIREEAGITQRQYAQATGVSQTLIARIESGDLSLKGPKGEQVMSIIFESLIIPPYEESREDCFDPNELYAKLIDLQKRYMDLVVKRNKDKVAHAFKKLKDEKEQGENADESKVEDVPRVLDG